MNKAVAIMFGAAAGAGVMFILDPANGRKRRALVRDKTVKAWNESSRAVNRTTRDLRNRSAGLAHDARKAVNNLTSTLQGSKGIAQRAGERMTETAAKWSPALRWIATGAGGAMTVYGLKKRDTLGTTMGMLGIGMLSRGIGGPQRARA